MKLKIIIASTRPGRVGLPVGKWFYEYALQHEKFDIEFVDLAEINLPLIDEPHHPRVKNYQHEHTKKWSEMIDSADAYVVVTPEYNYGMAPALLNAMDYLYSEWNYKPVGFVSYGGISGGMRSVQMTKQVVTTLKMMPLPEAVNVVFVAQHVKDGIFTATEEHKKAAKTMLDEMYKWAEALLPLHQK